LGEVPDTFKYVSKVAGISGLVKILLGKVGGIMFVANAISKLREGDTLGVVEDVTKFLAGKAAAAGVATLGTTAAAATAIPTGGGSIAAGALTIPAATLAADMLAAHLVGKAFDMYRGRYRGPTSKQTPDSTSAKIPRMHDGGVAGEIKKDELPAILQRGEAVLSKLQIGSFTKLITRLNELGEFGNATVQPQKAPEMRQVNTPDPLMMMSQLLSQSSTQPAPQIKVDTTGIEQKLNAFIVALNNIQINMDGASVGKVLVNASDAATTLGLFRPDSRATF
jgi:hypothetical protein